MAMNEPTTRANIDLNIRGENIQELFSWYLEERLVVNRRYQRKLVWSKAEKAHLIDTLTRRYPLPLILLAETHISGTPKYEIIDGLQRLNAIFSFIENRFDVGGLYFDLEAMASTKQLRDDNLLFQKEPMLDRKLCTYLANYKIPISTYRIEIASDIDEIFRRINSNGRLLSNQEIRQAGVTGVFADLVRSLATEIRGDVSHEEILPLNRMKAISITSKELDEYGIKVDNIFWVRNGILLKEDIRDSRDEDLIADLVAYIVSPEDNKPSSSRQALDEYYGRPKDSSERAVERAAERKREIDGLVSRTGVDTLMKAVLGTHELFVDLCSEQGFKAFLDKGSSRNYGVPRYYQVVFLAVHQLLHQKHQKLTDRKGLLATLSQIEKHIDPSTGGNWSAKNRESNVNAVRGVIEKHFKRTSSDPSLTTGRVELENLLTRSKTEASSYDFKQGFCRLDQAGGWDEDAFTKVLQTICALANLGKGKTGYVVIGIADKAADAQRIKILHHLEPKKVGEFYVVGVDREAKGHSNLDKYFQMISDKISKSNLSDEIRIRVSSSISQLVYYNRTVIVVRVEAGTEPCFLNGSTYRRSGTSTVEVTGRDIVHLAKLF
ncbi:GmrSD restriction endonuclease domain-containing protein [Nannocystis exedens]|nr:DUF262 domain-containing protein [Nannocystis exedens]